MSATWLAVVSVRSRNPNIFRIIFAFPFIHSASVRSRQNSIECHIAVAALYAGIPNDLPVICVVGVIVTFVLNPDASRAVRVQALFHRDSNQLNLNTEVSHLSISYGLAVVRGVEPIPAPCVPAL